MEIKKEDCLEVRCTHEVKVKAETKSFDILSNAFNNATPLMTPWTNEKVFVVNVSTILPLENDHLYGVFTLISLVVPDNEK